MHGARKRVVLVGLCFVAASGSGCSESGASKMPPIVITPAQSACLSRVWDAQRDMDIEFRQRAVETLGSAEPRITATIERRRAVERLCHEEANCVPVDDLRKGSMFDSCVDKAEADWRGV